MPVPLPSLVRPTPKQAALGGPGNDSSFEQTMSSLAHAHVRENAPELMKHELGFQLLDRSPDDRRAVGIMGFQVGNELCYVPLFFLSGQLKGHELLYRQQKDKFIPCKESWVRWLQNRQTSTLGQGVTRNVFALGVRQPRLMDLEAPPFGKYSAAVKGSAVEGTVHPELVPGVAGLARHLLAEGSAWPETDLGAFLKRAGLRCVELLAETLRRFPKVAEAVGRHYPTARMLREALAAQQLGAGILGTAAPGRSAKEAALRDRHGVLAEALAKQGEVEVVLSGQRAEAADLSEADRDKLLRDGYLVRDERPEAAKAIAYTVDTGLNLSNPDCPGVYEVLTKDGRLEECVVLPLPWSTRGQHAVVQVLRRSDPRAFVSAPAAEVWVRTNPLGDPKGELGKFLAGLPEATDGAVKGKGCFILIGPQGDCTVPMEVSRFDSAPSARDRSFCVWQDRPYRTSSSEGDSEWQSGRRRASGILFGTEADRNNYGSCRLHLVDDPFGTARATGDDLYVPADWRFLRVKTDDDPSYGEAGGYPVDSDKDDKAEAKPKPEPLVLGRNLDFQQALYSKLASHRLQRDETDALYLDGRPLVDRGDAVRALVTGLGLGADSADALLARVKEARAVRFLVKRALGEPGSYPGQHELQQSAPFAPAFPEPLTGMDPLTNLAGAIYPQHEQVPTGLPVPGQWPVYDPGKVPGPNYLESQELLQAAQTGQKQVFDTTVIGQLLRSSGDQSIIEPELPALRQALHALGRMYLRFLWHSDEMEDRFGKADMPAIEDSIRSNFDDLGDLVLELQTKSVGSDEDDGFVDINDSAD